MISSSEVATLTQTSFYRMCDGIKGINFRGKFVKFIAIIQAISLLNWFCRINRYVKNQKQKFGTLEQKIAIVESMTLIHSTQVQRCDTNCDSTPGFRPFFCRKFAVFTVIALKLPIVCNARVPPKVLSRYWIFPSYKCVK